MSLHFQGTLWELFHQSEAEPHSDIGEPTQHPVHHPTQHPTQHPVHHPVDDPNAYDHDTSPEGWTNVSRKQT